ncbi:MAG: hypothetical protein AAGH74_07400 [Pseudomonadota bacterium]
MISFPVHLYPVIYEAILQDVRRCLREDWDPIEVSRSVPQCYGEYDSYPVSLSASLCVDADPPWIRDRLLTFLEKMGQEGKPDQVERLPEIARMLCDIRDKAVQTHDR